MDQFPSLEGPSFGIVNAESITEGVQACQVALEESRLRLTPLVNALDANNDGAIPSAKGQLCHDNYTDGQTSREFAECIEHVWEAIDALMARLANSGLIAPNNSNEPKRNNGQEEESVYLLIASKCLEKASDFIGHHCMTLLEADSFDVSGAPLDDCGSDSHEGGSRIQPTMARLTELALKIAHIRMARFPPSPSAIADEGDDEPVTASGISEAYVEYQRRCLRARAKPAISSIAELRRVASSQQCFVSDILEAEERRRRLEVGADEDDAEEYAGGGQQGTRGQPHAQAITVILGEASSLIQPLGAWRDALSSQSDYNGGAAPLLQRLCQESMEMLDDQAQALAVTVGSWFRPDQRGLATLDGQDNTTGKEATKSDLLSIEASLEEMAFLCQVVSRYCVFSEQTLARGVEKAGAGGDDPTLQNLLVEQSLHYSTLETRLATLQFRQALALASPQLVEMGRSALKVPSIVEDSHFVCVRALERAAGTRSERALWTVGHWVCEVWGVDPGGGATGGDEGVKGVYRALMQGVGCTEAPAENSNRSRSGNDDVEPPKSGNTFAAALLDAADEGSGKGEQTGSTKTGSGTSSAPASGGLTSYFVRGEEQRQQSTADRLTSECCTLNGIAAAATACSALSRLFADFVEEYLLEETANPGAGETALKSSSMLTLAKDELASHSRSYQHLLQGRVRALMNDLCGGEDIFDCDGRLCLQNLRLFLENEVYNLDSSSLRSLEGEDRLEQQMIGPVRQSQIFEVVSEDKCDATVVLQMAVAMSWKSADIILQVLFQGGKDFNEWGAMLLSKQVRMLQNLYCGLVLESPGSESTETAKAGVPSSISTAFILTEFERVNQAVSILQLEKPSDWLAFAYKVGESDATNLKPDEIRKVMSLRMDFTDEAINNLRL